MMRVSLWPQSLFGRLLAASVAAVLLAQAAGLFLIAQERERFVLQGSVRFADGAAVLFRVTRMPRGAPLPRNLFINLTLLVLILVIVLYLAARNITRPLSELAHAADSIGRDIRPAQLQERGARELRNAARAFNTMQDRLRRYLDSRTRVLAAMSHDLKTPLTRLRLQVEAVDNL